MLNVQLKINCFTEVQHCKNSFPKVYFQQNQDFNFLIFFSENKSLFSKKYQYLNNILKCKSYKERAAQLHK